MLDGFWFHAVFKFYLWISKLQEEELFAAMRNHDFSYFFQEMIWWFDNSFFGKVSCIYAMSL